MKTRIASFAVSIILLLAAPVASAFSFGGTSAVTYPDGDIAGFDSGYVEYIKKQRALVERTDKCYFAMNRDLFDWAKKKADPYWRPKSIICVQDVSIHQGTINETSGCTLLRFNIESGGWTDYANQYFKPAMASKACKAGGFEELMAMRGYFSPDAYSGSSIEEMMFTPPQQEIADWRYFLVYAKDEKLVNWFSAARARGKIFMDGKLKKKK